MFLGYYNPCRILKMNLKLVPLGYWTCKTKIFRVKVNPKPRMMAEGVEDWASFRRLSNYQHVVPYDSIIYHRTPFSLKTQTPKPLKP